MKNNRLVVGTILLASLAAIVTPLTAEAFGRGGGGGGGGHFGGGGGGGGGHFGGGGGGFHLGGGGMHLGGGGGGGMMRLGGGGGGLRLGGMPHVGGARLGGGHIGGLRVGGLHPGGLSQRTLNPGTHTLQSGRSFANLHGLSRTHGPLATRVGPGFSRHAFLHDGFFAHNGFPHFRRFAVFGWV